MMANASSRQFRAYLTGELLLKYRDATDYSILHVAEHIADEMRKAVHSVSGNLAKSIVVVAEGGPVKIVCGGPLTTKYYKRGGYAREVKIGQGNNSNIGRGIFGVSYDYALATEFGTQHEPAHPFFFTTFRAESPFVLAQVRKDLVNASDNRLAPTDSGITTEEI